MNSLVQNHVECSVVTAELHSSGNTGSEIDKSEDGQYNRNIVLRSSGNIVLKIDESEDCQ